MGVKRYSIDNPHPDHVMSVWRSSRGRAWNGATCYATFGRCSCGWRPGSDADPNKIANEAPSLGGRRMAEIRYRDHLAGRGLT